MVFFFINYCHTDGGGYAGELHDRLRHWFDDEALPYDLDGIDAGDSFPEKLEDGMRSARVVLVVGPDGVATLNECLATPAVACVATRRTLTHP